MHSGKKMLDEDKRLIDETNQKMEENEDAPEF